MKKTRTLCTPIYLFFSFGTGFCALCVTIIARHQHHCTHTHTHEQTHESTYDQQRTHLRRGVDRHLAVRFAGHAQTRVRLKVEVLLCAHATNQADVADAQSIKADGVHTLVSRTLFSIIFSRKTVIHRRYSRPEFRILAREKVYFCGTFRTSVRDRAPPTPRPHSAPMPPRVAAWRARGCESSTRARRSAHAFWQCRPPTVRAPADG